MAMAATFDWRRYDRRLFLAAAVIFPLLVLIGFGRTYYFKAFTDAPPLPTMIVHLHGLVMSVWVLFFISQVWLIRSKNTKTHMSMGLIGIALAAVVLVFGFFTAAGMAKNGSPSSPPGITPMAFSIVPFTDLLMFVLFFGGAIYYRKSFADHKRLMLLTAFNFLPPALARIPVASLQSLGPLLFFGAPSVLLVGLLIYDTRKNGKLNRVFLIGSVALIASYPLRMLASGTDTWLAIAGWITSWAA